MSTTPFLPPSGVQFKGGGPIEYQIWQRMDAGSSIEVAFDPVDPSRNLPVAADRLGVWIAYFGAIVFAGASFFLVRFVLLPLAIRFVNGILTLYK